MTRRAPATAREQDLADRQPPTEADYEAAAQRTPRMFLDPARGWHNRRDRYATQRATIGDDLGALRFTHAWRPQMCQPESDAPTDRCQPTALACDLRCDCWHGPMGPGQDHCQCVGDLIYRGACLGCDWEGEDVDDENTAVEDALDHSWPGWRTYPPVKRWPEFSGSPQNRAKQLHDHLDLIAHHYPNGWIAMGGPIRTIRGLAGTRHHVSGPFGGMDVGVLDPLTIGGERGHRPVPAPTKAPAKKAPAKRPARKRAAATPAPATFTADEHGQFELFGALT